MPLGMCEVSCELAVWTGVAGARSLTNRFEVPGHKLWAHVLPNPGAPCFSSSPGCESQGDDQLLKLLTHIHTRTEEELEKRTPPGLALLHKLTRTTDAALRGRILRHYLVPQGTVKLPDGTQARSSARAANAALNENPHLSCIRLAPYKACSMGKAGRASRVMTVVRLMARQLFVDLLLPPVRG